MHVNLEHYELCLEKTEIISNNKKIEMSLTLWGRKQYIMFHY